MRQFRTARRLALFALVAALAAACAQSTRASQGFALPLPKPPKTQVAGLTLLFDCTWADGSGYVPMRVTVNRGGPAAADRTLAVEITNRTMGERRPVTVTANVTIPASATSVTQVIPFPRCSSNYQLSLSVWEGRAFLEDLSFEGMSMWSGGIGQNAAPATLFVSSTLVDVSQFDFVTNGSFNQSFAGPVFGPAGAPNQTSVATIAQIVPFASLAASDLFDNWINYSGLDVIFISLADVEDLAARRPKVWQALADWTMAGGNLCVFGVGDDWKGLETLEARLDVPADPAAAEKPYRGWNKPRRELYNQDLQMPGGAIVVKETDSDDEAKKKDAQALFGKPGDVRRTPFVSRNAGLGMVAAIAAANPFPGKSVEWRWLFNTIGPDRWQWSARHGLSIANGNPNFDDFTIEDAGVPPVKAYRVLITLFVVLIGPVNYWLLKRKGRLHLLLFTVPAAAVFVSASLVAYAVVADGFDTYLRSRSYTELDQQHDKAVSWARLSYYAGLAPPGGLLFGLDTAVLPIEREAYWERSVHPLRQTDWESEQRLARGWLPSRTPTQCLTVRPYASQRELRIVQRDGWSGCAIENRLGTKINHLMLRSAAGDLYYGRAIDPDARATLEALDTDAKAEQVALKMLGERNRHALFVPSVGTTPASQIFFGPARVNGRFLGNNNYSGDTGSLLETGFIRAFDEIGSQLPQPRTYVAIVERPPDVETGTSGLKEQSGLHVIRGTW